MPSPSRRKIVHNPDLGPTMEKRKQWADAHERGIEKARQAGLLLPGDPHYVCNHPRLDDPAYVFGRLVDPTARLAWRHDGAEGGPDRASADE